MLRQLPLFALSASVLALVAFPAGCSSPASGDETDSSGDHLEEPADGIFTSLETVPFKLDAPFAQLIGRFRNGAADPPKPSKDGGADAESEGGVPRPPTVKKPDFSEPGHVVFGGKTLDVKVAIRGNTSPRDCTFPKYSIEFTNKDQVKGTPFQANKKVRVNSHCGDGGPNDRGGQFQRIQNEISPIREEMVYRLIRASGTATYRTRLAKISYSDTSATSPLPAMEHHGLVIESGDDAAKRFAAAGLIDKARGIYLNDPTGQPQFVGADFNKMKLDDVANVYLAEAMSSNVDWISPVPSAASRRAASGTSTSSVSRTRPRSCPFRRTSTSRRPSTCFAIPPARCRRRCRPSATSPSRRPRSPRPPPRASRRRRPPSSRSSPPWRRRASPTGACPPPTS